MRSSDYRKKLQLDQKTWKIIWGCLAAAALVGGIAFFSYYKVEHVEVMGCSHYTEEEIKSMVLRGPLASNSVLAPLVYTKKENTGVPFVEGFTVTQLNRSTICISVKEKKPVGCIPYLDSYIYFDRNGIFIEGSKTRAESVPYFDGIQVNHVIMNEKLPIKGNTVLNTAVALSTIFQKNQMIPDHIQFDESYQISLIYGDIVVQLGKDENLEEKMTRAIAILHRIAGKKGILHMESVATDTNTFEEDQTEEESTAENWNGGYDEYGDYTGYGEYDENGNYVGPKPMTELDYAIQAWNGGYDGEGDYTGAGEYDEYGNYTGPKPTQEMLDANGDWKGGYLEDGSYVGYGEFDREGNYVGPNPNEGQDVSESDENASDGDYSGEGSYYENEDESYEDESYGGYDSSYEEGSYYEGYYDDGDYNG